MNTDRCYLVALFKTQIDFSPFSLEGTEAFRMVPTHPICPSHCQNLYLPQSPASDLQRKSAKLKLSSETD